MKKIILGLVVCGFVTSVSAECTYNFDAPTTKISTYNAGYKKFPNVNGNKFSYLTGAMTEKTYAAFSNKYLSNVLEN